MRISSKWSSAAFERDRSGNFALITAAISSVLALSVGFAVNIAQFQNVKSSLRSALDAAVTSTARDLTIGKIAPKDARARVEAFLKANADPELIAGDRVVLGHLIVDQTANTVEAMAYVDTDAFFPVFSSANHQRISSTSAALYSDKAIEVAMMLDITGSMKKTAKIDKIGDLRKAASNAVELLLGGQDPKKPRVRVAIVPYAEAVNTGKLADVVFVEEPGGSNLPPAIDSPLAAAAQPSFDGCAHERKNKDGRADFSDDSPYAERKNNKGKTYLARINRDDRIQVCPRAELIPLTANKQMLLDTIDDFVADGVTAGGIAAQWGYYMLSPNWRGAIVNAGAGAGPADFNPKKVAKVAILMTDGQFNTAFAGVKDGDTPQLQQGAKSRSYAERLCANMKGDGIEVFTIGFDLNNPGMSRTERDQAKSVLKNCSTDDTPAIKHYFEASTGEELDAAFREIIANTERLAITK
jgi:Flp pilus assembly protein TadG